MYPPRMSAAEFALIADTIYRFGESLSDEDRERGYLIIGIRPLRDDLVTQFADALARTNSNFDRDRFLTAATTGQNVKPGPRA